MFKDEGADLPFTPPMKDNRYIVPNGIRPVMVRTGIEVSVFLQDLPCIPSAIQVYLVHNYESSVMFFCICICVSFNKRLKQMSL